MIDKSAIDIVQVISEHIELTRHGRTYFGLCPFHTEKTPSFAVSPSKQRFHCFGCHESGDAIDFVQKISGMSFSEAYRFLTGETTTARSHRQVARIKYEREIQRQIDDWCRRYADECALIMRCCHKVIDAKTPGFDGLYLQAQIAEYHLNILIRGDKDEIRELYNERSCKTANSREYSCSVGSVDTPGTRRVPPPRRCRAIRVLPRR